MMEEEYQGEIPCYFLCPISMQIMKDPVTVPTGITYDRESIQKWLFSCKKTNTNTNTNTTCPVTKQPLSTSTGAADDILTPNHTLRRLIQGWCTLNALERIPTPKQSLHKSQILNLLNQAKSKDSPTSQLHCLQRLRSIARSSESSKQHMQAAGAASFLLSVVGKHHDNDDDGVLRDEALGLLHEIELSDSDLKSFFVHNINGIFIADALIQVLRNGDSQNRGRAITLLRSAFAVADPVNLIGSKPEVFVETVRVLRDRISTRTAVKLLVELCPWGKNRIKAAEAGAVAAVIELLLEESERRGSELALAALDQLCGCAEGRAELLRHGAGLAVVSKKILRVSGAASDRAVRILGSISRFAASGRVLEEMVDLGVVRKLCLVLQVEGSEKTKGRVKEMLRLHARVWKDSSCIPPHLLSYPSSTLFF